VPESFGVIAEVAGFSAAIITTAALTVSGIIVAVRVANRRVRAGSRNRVQAAPLPQGIASAGT
jgi:hypothetical protein